MTKFIKGDIFEQKYRNPQTCIIHQCNCIAILPHGLSQNIAEEFGSYANSYGRRQRLSRNIAAVSDRPEPGTLEFCKGSPNVVALFAQFSFGKPARYNFNFDTHIKRGCEHDTKENRMLYFKLALTNLKNFLQEDNNTIFERNKVYPNELTENDFFRKSYIREIHTIIFPHKIGCGLAGGEWNEYKKEIENFASQILPRTVLILEKNS